MINLAGVIECDIQIEKELFEAGIKAVKVNKDNSEVPYSIVGSLGSAEFYRGCDCWVVKCHIPLELAEKIYATQIGAKDIRVEDHCGSPHPEELIKMGYINCYHIDSQEGLNLFVEFLNGGM